MSVDAAVDHLVEMGFVMLLFEELLSPLLFEENI